MSLEIRTGRRIVEISRPDKPLFPCGITKADLARYYEQVGETMLSHIARHPLNLERYPDGIERPAIFQQKAGSHFPGWIGRVEVPKKGGTVEHVVADQPAALIYLAGQACITPHAWLSRADRLDRPDRMIFDLDPSEGGTADVRTAVAPYAVRARPHAPVATPLHWEELSERQMRPDRFTLRDVPARLEQDGDAWKDAASQAQTLTEARRRLERALAEQGVQPA